MKLLIATLLIGLTLITVSTSQIAVEPRPTPTPTPTPDETRTPTPTPEKIAYDIDARKYITLEEELKIKEEISRTGDFAILGINKPYHLLRYSDNSSIGLLFNYEKAIG